MLSKKSLGILAGLLLVLVLSACGGSDDGEQGSVSEQMDYTITGIEPGAGITDLTNQALDHYDSLSGWEQENSSTGAMLSALNEAIEDEEPIVVTGWNPHFMFAKWDLKYLKDPDNVYGDAEHVTAIVRNELENDMPNAYKIIDRFNFEVDEIEEALLKVEEGAEMEDVAQEWIDKNQDTVDEWKDGIDSVDGKSIELASTQWGSELFTSNVANIVMSDLGFDVTVTPVDPAIVFESVATGGADASLAPWMPVTHASFYEKHEGNFEDLGPVYEQAKVGLAVPEYMDIESIEDLEAAE